MRRNWIAVASADHVRRGRAAGFMQVSHGKRGPLCRIGPGDLVAYYSPTAEFGGKEKCQAFTAFGIAGEGEPYQVDDGRGFHPFRRDVTWLKSRDAPIGPLLSDLEFTAGKRNWGYQLRFGLIEMSARDMQIIARAMGIKRSALRDPTHPGRTPSTRKTRDFAARLRIAKASA